MEKTNEERIALLEKRVDIQDQDIEQLIDLVAYFVLEKKLSREDVTIN